MFSKKIVAGIVSGALLAVSVCQPVYCLGYDRIDWNRVNMAYKNNDTKMIDKLINIDESNIVDEVIPAAFTVQESKKIRDINNKYMIGVGYETGHMPAEQFFTKGTIELAPGYMDLAERITDYPIFRYGGATSSSDSWITKIGELGRRTAVGSHEFIYEYVTGTPGSRDSTNRANEIGPVEFHKITQAINPNAKYIITLPWYSFGTEDLLRVMSFYLDKKDESEWGALRASLGIEEPIDVYCWELGNEIYCNETSSYNNERTAKQFIKDMQKFLPVAKKAYPKAKFGVSLRGNHQAEDDPSTYNNWNIWMAEGVGHLVDYGIPHMYYSGYEPAYFMFWLYDQYSAFKNVLGDNCNIKFLITEHGQWPKGNDLKEFSTHSLYGVLAISQMYNLFYEVPFVECSTYYGWYNSTWAVAKQKNNQWLMMGIPHMQDLYIKNIGDTLVKSELKSGSDYTNPDSTKRRFTGITMKDGDDLVIFLTNRLPYVEFNLTFEFENEYDLVEESVLTAPNIYSFVNNKKSEDIFKTTVTQKNEKNFSEYKMPGKSLVVLRLKKHS